MTGDRRLSEQEMLDFKLEKAGSLFKALAVVNKTVLEANEEPTLFELAIIELAAQQEALKRILIDLGWQVRQLKRNEASGRFEVSPREKGPERLH